MTELKQFVMFRLDDQRYALPLAAIERIVHAVEVTVLPHQQGMVLGVMNMAGTAGYKVTSAIDGIEAFTLLRSEKFDVLVSDVEMPRLNGFDLTARVRADARLAELPVVLVTGLETREDRERGIDVGANAYIVKSSLDQSDLLDAVRRLA